MFGDDKQHDLEKIYNVNKNGRFGKNAIKNDEDYDNFIRIQYEFENKDGKYYKYRKVISGKLLYFFYKNILFNHNEDIILLDIYNYKKDKNDINILNIYSVNKINFNGNLIFIVKEFNSNKYIQLFNKIFINYGNDIQKNAKGSLIFFLYKINRLLK